MKIRILTAAVATAMLSSVGFAQVTPDDGELQVPVTFTGTSAIVFNCEVNETSLAFDFTGVLEDQETLTVNCDDGADSNNYNVSLSTTDTSNGSSAPTSTYTVDTTAGGGDTVDISMFASEGAGSRQDFTAFSTSVSGDDSSSTGAVALTITAAIAAGEAGATPDIADSQTLFVNFAVADDAEPGPLDPVLDLGTPTVSTVLENDPSGTTGGAFDQVRTGLIGTGAPLEQADANSDGHLSFRDAEAGLGNGDGNLDENDVPSAP